MAANINDIDAKLIHRIQDGDYRLGGSAAAGSSPARLEAIGSARVEYEASFPRERVVELAGDGGFDYAIAGLTGFVDGFSSITQIRYPVVASDPAPPALDETDYVVVRLPTGVFLRFLNGIKPLATEKFHPYFTTPHTLDGASSTIPSAHDDALADLAAHHACLMLAAFYEQTGDSSIDADAVDRPRRTDTYRALAKAYRASYEEKLGLRAPAKAALATADLNPGFSDRRAGGLLFHERR
jgi:hypothetical protein